MIVIHQNKDEQITGYGFPSYCDEIEETTISDLLTIIFVECVIVMIALIVGFWS